MGKRDEENEIATFEKKLVPFLKRHLYSKVQKKEEAFYIVKPWNDDSMALILKPKSAPRLIDALNNLVLPPRFIAIYHLDSNTMEYIYTLLDEEDPCFKRQFEFTLASKTYLCRYAKASERLLTISELFRRVRRQSGTEFRNLLLLREYVQRRTRRRIPSEDFGIVMEPISFYVSGFKSFNEAEIIEVSKHLNFFMEYYDRGSSYIIIHSVESELLETPKQLQFVETAFPKSIRSRRQDPFLLDLALAASMVEARLQFIYYYQILECAAAYYIDDDTRRQLQNIICTPDIHSNLDRHVSRILETVSTSVRQDEEAKVQKVVKRACHPEVIWKEIQESMPYFSETQNFDGGFEIGPFISEDTTLDSFCAMWHPKTIDTIRIIRNALVHGRERRFGRVISPTPRNDQLIEPWVAIARRIAEQVIIFGRET